MQTEQHKIEHRDSLEGGTFFIDRDGQRIAELTYARKGKGVVVADHTFVSPILRGQGIAKKLVDALASWARANDEKIIPTCSYVVKLFGEDSSYADITLER